MSQELLNLCVAELRIDSGPPRDHLTRLLCSMNIISFSYIPPLQSTIKYWAPTVWEPLHYAPAKQWCKDKQDSCFWGGLPSRGQPQTEICLIKEKHHEEIQQESVGDSDQWGAAGLGRVEKKGCVIPARIHNYRKETMEGWKMCVRGRNSTWEACMSLEGKRNGQRLL